MANLEVRRAKEKLSAAITDARTRGVTWHNIGQALGMTRQAAYQRFGQATKLSGEPMPKNNTSHARQMIETCFTDIAAGAPEKVTALMTAETAATLTEADIVAVWDQVVAAIGAFQSCSNTTVESADGSELPDGEDVLGPVVAVTTLNFEAGEMMGRLAIDAQGKIAGILILEPGTTSYPF